MIKIKVFEKPVVPTAQQKNQAKFAQLLKDRAQAFPNETYQQSWNAIAQSEEGEELLSGMQRAERVQFVNELPTIPAQNQRTCALVGLTWPADDAEYRRKFTALLNRGRPGLNQPPSASSGPDPIREEAERLFLEEVAKLQSKGFGYAESWTQASIVEPGRSFFQIWRNGAGDTNS